MRKIILTVICLAVMTCLTHGKTVYVAVDGSDSSDGTIEAPLATLPAAYEKIAGGDTICFRGGTYKITDEQVMGYDGLYACVFMLAKAGTCIMGYPGDGGQTEFCHCSS